MYQDWTVGEVSANLYIFLYLYLGTWLSIGGTKEKIKKYFGENGLYIPEESINYLWSFKLGKFYIKVLPKGKIDGKV
jgi:hypothetical protein